MRCISANASSRSFTGQTVATGPKISSRPMLIAGDTWSNTVGPTKNPSVGSAALRPSATSLAPSATPVST